MSETASPLNVWSRSDEELGRLLSNFAHTPFSLDGVDYASIEGFYVALLHHDARRRAKIAGMWGLRAKHEHPHRTPPVIHYFDEAFAPGSAAHWTLIKRALRAKLLAHPALAAAFVATGARPLVHETGYPDAPDAVFPAHVFCRLLTELRDELAARERTTPQATSTLIAALDHPDEAVRHAAVKALGEMGDARAVEPLTQALRDMHWAIRRNAAQWLGSLKDARAVEPLMAALDDEDEAVRGAAVDALGEIGDPRAVEGLTRALQDLDWAVRRRAARVLGSLKDARAVGPLRYAFNHDYDEDVHEAVADALLALGDPRVP